MFKLNGKPKEKMRIKLPEKWHKKIVDFNKTRTYPYEYEIESIVKDKAADQKYCICRAIDNSVENNKIILTEYAAKYLLAEEVEDSNVGLLFKEYLPKEDSKLLITNVRNPSNVVPAIIHIDARLIAVKSECFVGLEFIINYMNGEGFTAINYYCDGNKKSTWKLLLNKDTSYMTDYEKMFCDTLIHKEFIEKSCRKLATYLEKEGALEHARMLMERAKVHDDSKISREDELHALASIINDKSNLLDPTLPLSEIKQNAIKIHWKHNTHHPEHYNTPIDMSKLDIMEMCCDWHARSVQYNTNFLEFVKERQEDRFHFPDWMFAEIWHYCEVLNAYD